MTNLLLVLPDFDIKPYTHILPSLEKALISTADLLTLDATDVAKRAQVPPGEVRKLVAALIEGLHGPTAVDGGVEDGGEANGGLGDGQRLADQWRSISTLDDGLDGALNGGIAAGSVTEFVGESAAGKTQLLLTLLLSVQLLPSQGGLGKSALYISTEAPLQTTRLAQILKAHPKLSTLPTDQQPSLARIQSAHVHDLEAQDHILRYQVPVVIRRHNVGLLIIDSIAANYRAEFDKGKARKSAVESFAKRSNQIAQLGALLREIARTHRVAVVVANQVADRFLPVERQALSQVMQTSQQHTQRSRPGSPPQSTSVKSAYQLSQHLPSSDVMSAPPPLLSTDDPLALDHQQRFFTGWGDDPSPNLKTPSLGLTWTNQIAARIALLKEPVQSGTADESWRRTSKVVFSSWCAESKTEFEITEGGVRSIRDGQTENQAT